MANVWSTARFRKTVIICGFALSSVLIGSSVSSALATTDISVEDNQQLEEPNRVISQVENSTGGNASDQSEFVIAAVRTLLSDLEQFPLFLPETSGTLVTASDQLSSKRQSQPSLFWIQDQVSARYGSDRLVTGWRAYRVNNADGTSLNYVDAIVNERIWDFLNYFERYAFIEQFGTAAQDYGYHLRVFHTGDAANASEARTSNTPGLVTLRGAHICSFGPSPLPTVGSSEALPCAVIFDALSRRRQRSILSN